MANQIAYGFLNLTDIFGRRVTEAGVAEIVRNAIDETVAEHQRQQDALFGLFVRRTTDFKTVFNASSGAGRLQPLDEGGRARPIKPAGQYERAFPIQMGGTAWGADYVTRAYMTVREAADATQTMVMQDLRWMRDHILAALYTNVSWSFTDKWHGALTVLPLANADAELFGILAGADAPATDQHFLAQANAISDTDNPYPTIFTELSEHPENGGKIVALIPSGLVATTRALASFYPEPDVNIALGTGQNRLVGDLGITVPGTLIGYEDSGVWVVEWPSLPANYIIAVATEGDRALAMREDPPETGLQGFHVAAERADHPWWERQYLRRAGFGADNRVGALVYRIGNGSYAVPTGYAAPVA